MPDGLIVDHLIDQPNSLKNLATPATGYIDGWGMAYYPNYIVDGAFNDSLNSDELRLRSGSLGWYESGRDEVTQLTLDAADIAGNISPKAKFVGSSAGYALLTQEFAVPQTGKFSIQWDIYVDKIINTNTDRSAYMLIGDDQDGISGPNSSPLDRFVYLAFYKAGGGTTGLMELVARQPGDGAGAGEFTKISTGLNLDQWYTIRVEVDTANHTYDIFINGTWAGGPIQAWNPKDSLTHISFASFASAYGTFYTDNVIDSIARSPQAASTDIIFNRTVELINGYRPQIVHAQIRQCATGCCDPGNETIVDPYPFFREKNGKRWTFSHDGSVVKSLLNSLIGDVYLRAHAPFGSEVPACFTADPFSYLVGDSELYFLYLLKKIEEKQWDVTQGIVSAVNELMSFGESGLNFILSDGERIWAFRKAELPGQTLFYLHDAQLAYSAVASQYPTGSQGDWISLDNENLVILASDQAPAIIDAYTYDGALLVDSDFNASSDSQDLQADTYGQQDWYESLGQDPALLTLNFEEIGGNNTAKAKLDASLTDTATYLTQGFNTAQTDLITVQWDVYVDRILDDADRDRGALMTIGDDSNGDDGPNTGAERFVVLAFYSEDGGGDEPGDTMTLIAREADVPFDDSSAWRQLASGITFDAVHTIAVTCDVIKNTYDVYLDGELVVGGVIAFNSKTSLTHISFSQSDAGSATFYIDNVREIKPPAAAFYAYPRSGTMPLDVNFTGLMTADPLSYWWDFGAGGNPSDLSDPVYTYRNPGKYDVTLMVENKGGIDWITKPGLIEVLPAEIINDNKGDDFEFVGDWNTSTNIPGFYGENYYYSDAGAGDNQATWHFLISQSGTYKVFAWWSADSTSSPNAPYTINHAFGSRTVWVDQRINGGQWNEIGEFYFTAGSFSITLTDNADGIIVADAIKLVAVNSEIPETTADFYANPKVCQAPCTIEFYEKSSGQISTYDWDFGDGGQSTAINPTHTFQAPGEYTVALTVSGAGGTDTITKPNYIFVTEVDITVDNTDPAYQTVGSWRDSTLVPGYYLTNYQYSSAGTGDDQAKWNLTVPQAGVYKVYAWWSTPHSSRPSNAPFTTNHAFGSTTVRVDQRTNGSQWNEIGEVYFDTGDYSVVLSDDADGSVAADAIRILFQTSQIPAPQADFEADIVLGLAPLNVQFQDKSSGGNSEWTWDFGDGTSSNEQNPNHTYVREGTYTVTLTVSGVGGSDSEIKEFFINIVRDTLILDNMSAEYVGSWPTSTLVPGYYEDDYRYNSSGSGQDQTIWEINLNKAGTYRVFAWWSGPWRTRPSNAPFTINHAFGSMVVRKDQRTDWGQWNSLGEFYFEAGRYQIMLSDQADGTVVADAIRLTYLYSEILPCEADFTSDAGSGALPLQVNFEDLSKGKINSWLWDFGDGTTSNAQNPSHTYNQNGIYPVSLTVTDDNGNDTKIKEMHVIVSDVDIISDNTDSTFQTVGSWPLSTLVPGYHSTNYQYNSAGLGDDRAIWNIAVPIKGLYKVYAWWSTPWGTRPSNAPYTIHHTFGSTTVRVDQRSNGSQWNEIGEVYFNEDNYVVELTDDADGSVVADAVRLIHVSDTIPVDFSADNRYGKNPLVVNFNSVTNNEDITDWEWDFGDGNTSNDVHPSHTYTEVGRFSVTLTVTDNQGQRSKTKSEFITVSDVEIIRDNSDPEFQTVGLWPLSTMVTGHYSTNYRYNKDGVGDHQASWNFAIPRAGLYKVFAWWSTPWDTRPSNAPFTINHAFGSTTVRVNQRINGGQWNEIGDGYFEEDNYSVTLTDDANGTVVADAVKVLFLTEEPPPPQAAFSHNSQIADAEAPATIQFTDESQGGVTNWYWDFGDGQVSSEQNPTHTYIYPGIYTVSLTVYDSQNNEDTIIDENAIVVTEVGNIEPIYLFFGYATVGASSQINLLEAMFLEIGAIKKENLWVYWNQANNRIYFIDFIYGPEGYTRWKEALQIENAHIIYTGHANYGSGHVFPESNTEVQSQAVHGVNYIDDERILNFQSKYFSLPIDYYINSQSFPDWQPIFSDGVSAVMPYKFNDPEFVGDPDNPGIPAFNYYITYQIPGDSTHYKFETLHHGAIERFVDSGRPAWYSPDGDLPDPANPDHQKYFITKPWGSGVRSHYGSKTIFYRRELEVDQEAFKYSRMFLHMCNTGYYFAETYNRGIMFYTLNDTSSNNVPVYLKRYLLGSSDEQIYEMIQANDPVFGYHNFNEPPPVTAPSFALEWDILIDEIIDSSENPDRAGMMIIGTDSGSSSGPNGTDTDRFIQMAFYKSGGGDTGTANLVARSRHDSWDSWTTLATDLEMDQWYTIKVVGDLIHDTFDVYLDGSLIAEDVVSRMPMDVVTHLTFAQQSAAAGTFYVDNVSNVIPDLAILTDGNFNASLANWQLLYNEDGQDWYESSNDLPELVTLNTDIVAENGTKKIRFEGSTFGSAYLTQELSPAPTK